MEGVIKVYIYIFRKQNLAGVATNLSKEKISNTLVLFSILNHNILQLINNNKLSKYINIYNLFVKFI